MELIRAADILVEKIKRDYKKDVAVVVIMGSTIYGETHSRSDLDLYFVVNNPKGFELGMAFIINGIGFDFWPITWERLTKMANHDERITSIITEGKVIYHGSDEDLNKFNAIKKLALDVSDTKKFIKKSRNVFNQVYKPFFWMEASNSISESRKYGLDVIYPLTNALALLNKDTIKRGRGKLKKELLEMPLLPLDFDSCYDVIFETNEYESLKNAIRQLVVNTNSLIESQEEKWITPVIDFKEHLHGFYEELINYYNKIYHGCDIGDFVTAFYAANEIVKEISGILAGTNVPVDDFPDIVGAYDPNHMDHFLDVVRQHQNLFEKLLTDRQVPVLRFEDMDALEEHLSK